MLAARAERAGLLARITVEDNGTGIDPAERLALFEPFRRFRRNDAATDEGLGLGLSICQRIVLAHGGTIDASPLQPGTRFAFTLLDPDAPPAPPHAAPPP